MVPTQKPSACRHILHRPLSKSSHTSGTPGQKQTKATRSIFRKQTQHSPQGHPTTHQRCPSFELLCGWPVQFRGAPMGSPCSPALCNLVVAVEEQCWHHTYAGLFFNHKFHQHSPHQRAIYLPLDTWTTEFYYYYYPNNFFRFHLSNNSHPHLFTSRRFSLKLNRPTFSLVSRWTPASVQSHTNPSSPRQTSSTPDLPQRHRHYEAAFRPEPD